MALCTMKNHSPLTLMAAALLGAAVATTMLLNNEPLGLSLTPRMETAELMDITAVAVGSVPRFSATAARYFALLRVTSGYFGLLRVTSRYFARNNNETIIPQVSSQARTRASPKHVTCRYSAYFMGAYLLVTARWSVRHVL